MAAIHNSILDSTKKKLGIDFDDTDYDEDIIDHINSVFSTQRLVRPSISYPSSGPTPS